MLRFKQYLIESDTTPPPQNDPGHPEPIQLPNGHWVSPSGPPQTIPSSSPDGFNPRDPSNPATYEEWLRQHREPPHDPNVQGDDADDAWQRWQKAREAAEDYYRNERMDKYHRQYYSPDLQGVNRGIRDLSKQVIPSELNPFW